MCHARPHESSKGSSRKYVYPERACTLVNIELILGISSASSITTTYKAMGGEWWQQQEKAFQNNSSRHRLGIMTLRWTKKGSKRVKLGICMRHRYDSHLRSRTRLFSKIARATNSESKRSKCVCVDVLCAWTWVQRTIDHCEYGYFSYPCRHWRSIGWFQIGQANLKHGAVGCARVLIW